MSKYIVQDTHIKHGKKGAKTAKVYGPGDEIELAEQEAETLGSSVKPAAESAASAVETEDLLAAAKAAIELGATISDGRPEVKAMEEFLGRDITAEERDQAWESLKAEEG